MVTLAALVVTLGGGCDKEDLESGLESPERTCRMPFAEYDAGGSVDGIEREAIVTNCGKRPFVTYIYGTCHATSDMGCAPPLEVQSWSACHRKPHKAAGPEVAVRRGRVTVVIFARSHRLARHAVGALRKAKPADPSLRLTRELRACGAR
jgi:hypothetical protein